MRLWSSSSVFLDGCAQRRWRVVPGDDFRAPKVPSRSWRESGPFRPTSMLRIFRKFFRTYWAFWKFFRIFWCKVGSYKVCSMRSLLNRWTRIIASFTNCFCFSTFHLVYTRAKCRQVKGDGDGETTQFQHSKIPCTCRMGIRGNLWWYWRFSRWFIVTAKLAHDFIRGFRWLWRTI